MSCGFGSVSMRKYAMRRKHCSNSKSSRPVNDKILPLSGHFKDGAREEDEQGTVARVRGADPVPFREQGLGDVLESLGFDQVGSDPEHVRAQEHGDGILVRTLFAAELDQALRQGCELLSPARERLTGLRAAQKQVDRGRTEVVEVLGSLIESSSAGGRPGSSLEQFGGGHAKRPEGQILVGHTEALTRSRCSTRRQFAPRLAPPGAVRAQAATSRPPWKCRSGRCWAPGRA